MDEKEKNGFENYPEINLLDLFFKWISKWKSIVVVVLIGCVLGAFISNNAYKKQAEVEAKEKENKLQDLEKYYLEKLEVKEVNKVNEIIEMCNDYERMVSFFELKKGDVEVKDIYSIESSLNDSKQTINRYIHELKLEQKELLMIRSEEVYKFSAIQEYLSEKKAETIETENSQITTKSGIRTYISKKGVLCAIAFLFIHVMIVACVYIFNGKVKYSDKLGRMLGCSELTTIVNAKKKKGLDKLFENARVHAYKKTNYNDAVTINANNITEISELSGFDSIALIGDESEYPIEEIKKQIEAQNKSVNVMCIKSVAFDTEGSRNISNAKACILFAKAEKTSYDDLIKEYRMVKMRRIAVIGTILCI